MTAPRRSLMAAALAAAILPLPAGAGESVSPKVGYMLYCSGCHGMDGTGSAAGGIPPFGNVVGSFTGTKDGRLYMANVPGVVGANVSPGLTASILNYVVDTYAGTSRNPAARRFDSTEVAELWAHRPDDVISLRRVLVQQYRHDNLPVPPDYPWP